jgi:hypothetical protein
MLSALQYALTTLLALKVKWESSPLELILQHEGQNAVCNWGSYWSRRRARLINANSRPVFILEAPKVEQFSHRFRMKRRRLGSTLRCIGYISSENITFESWEVINTKESLRYIQIMTMVRDILVSAYITNSWTKIHRTGSCFDARLTFQRARFLECHRTALLIAGLQAAFINDFSLITIISKVIESQI